MNKDSKNNRIKGMRGFSEGKSTSNEFYTVLCNVFCCMFKFFKKSKEIKYKSDEFDEKYKFILDLKLDSLEMYEKVKSYYYSKLNQGQ